jgi:hypothetical protein
MVKNVGTPVYSNTASGGGWGWGGGIIVSTKSEVTNSWAIRARSALDSVWGDAECRQQNYSYSAKLNIWSRIHVESARIFSEARFKLESASGRTQVALWFYTHANTKSAQRHKQQHKCLDDALGSLPVRNMCSPT